MNISKRNLINRLNKFIIKYNLKIITINELLSIDKYNIIFDSHYKDITAFLSLRDKFKYILADFTKLGDIYISKYTFTWETYNDIFFSDNNMSIFDWLRQYVKFRVDKELNTIISYLGESTSYEELIIKMDLIGI